MPPRRNHLLQPQTPTTSPIPYLGPPPTAAEPPSTIPLPPPSSLSSVHLQHSPHTTPRFTPPVLNVTTSSTTTPFSSTPPKPLPQPHTPFSRAQTQPPLDIRPSTTDTRFTLPPISPSTPLSLAPRLPTNDPSQLQTRRTWPPLYGTSPTGATHQNSVIPRLPGMEVVVISDSDDIQQPLRKRRREASAARRQRRRRAEYRLREEAVVEAARAVEFRRSAQFGIHAPYATGLVTGRGAAYSSTLATGMSVGVSGGPGTSLEGDVSRGLNLGVGATSRMVMGAAAVGTTPMRSAVAVTVSGSGSGTGSAMPRIPESLGPSARAPATKEDSAKLMRELRETALALHGMGMNAEAKALVQRTLPKLLKED